MRKLVSIISIFCCFFVIKQSSAQPFILEKDTSVGDFQTFSQGVSVNKMIGAYKGRNPLPDTVSIEGLSAGFMRANSGGFWSGLLTNVTAKINGTQQGNTLITVSDWVSFNGNYKVAPGEEMKIRLYADVDFSSITAGAAFATTLELSWETPDDEFQTWEVQGQVNYAGTRGTIGPEIITGYYVNRTDSSFTYVGKYNTFGIPTDIWPEIGTSGPYNFLQQPNLLTSTTTANSITVTVSGLDPDQSYYFRLAGENTQLDRGYGATIRIRTKEHPADVKVIGSSAVNYVIAPSYDNMFGLFDIAGDSITDARVEFQIVGRGNGSLDWNDLQDYFRVRIHSSGYYTNEPSDSVLFTATRWIDAGTTESVEVRSNLGQDVQAGDALVLVLKLCVIDEDDGSKRCLAPVTGLKTVVNVVSAVTYTDVRPTDQGITVDFNYSDVQLEMGDSMVDYYLSVGTHPDHLQYGDYGSEFPSTGSGSGSLTAYNLMPETDYFFQIVAFGTSPVVGDLRSFTTLPLPKFPPTLYAYCPFVDETGTLSYGMHVNTGNLLTTISIVYGTPQAPLQDTLMIGSTTENEDMIGAFPNFPMNSNNEFTYTVFAMNDSGTVMSETFYIRRDESLPPRSTPSTLAAKNVTETSATLQGFVDIGIVIPLHRFLFWKEGSFTVDSTEWKRGDGEVEMPVANLLPEQTYLYRVQIIECGNLRNGGVEVFYTSKATGISELQTGGRLFPNPTAGEVIIETEKNDLFMLYDVNGRNVFTAEVESGRTTLEHNNVAAGIYSYRLKEKSLKPGKLVLVE